MLDQVLSASAIGGPDKVRAELAAFVARTGADELMLTSAMFDHDARKRSLAIAAEAMQSIG
jgi:alkanesulfonate monooxygenase SsuD/methylene tetrahydromethanopterin reductase-like flavin-dependent oxidoreductase (luciferase family)